MLHYDEQRLNILVKRAREGDSGAFDELLRIFEPELRMIASRLYISGADTNDVLQETRIGLWRAVEDFKDNAGTTFHNFAINVCCKRRVYTAIKASNGKKYKIHNTAESLDRPIITEDDDSGQTLADFVIDHGPTPYDIVVNNHEFQDNIGSLRSEMTSMEEQVFDSFAKDQTYNEIGAELQINPKAADNALMRIRKKAIRIYQDYQREDDEPPKKRKKRDK
ncbi:MAG: sigma-70 family RNA polymerase sigma factor [Armatimonadetes bacterium]|nr:sigma-70 family RNA polymerase sigma factor [Armatimonadota bacterium]